MTTDVSKLLADPNPGITLDQLAREMNELAKVRNNARLAFCRRLAVAYLAIVGHVPGHGKRDSGKFWEWCSAKLRTANGRPYSRHTLNGYVTVAFSKNPQAHLRRDVAAATARSIDIRRLGAAVERAVRQETPPKVIPLTKLKAQGMPTDVAQEVNVLMTAWEQASSQARSQFIYIVTGKRIAA